MKRFMIALAAGISLAACTQDALPPTAAPVGTLPLTAKSVAGDDLQVFAQSLAKSLANPATRLKLRDAWRNSRVSSDHKLVSNEYFLSSEGESVVADMARAAGTSAASMTTLLRRLPALDVYLPIRAHRNTWRASNDVLVAASLNHNVEQVQAYDVDGATHTVDAEAAEKGRPLVFIHAAEPKYPIAAAQTYSSGDVIESVDAYAATAQAPSASASLNTSSLLTAGVKIKYFDAFRGDGAFGGDLEMEFYVSGYEQNFLPYYNALGPDWVVSDCLYGSTTAVLPDNPPVWVNITVVSNMSPMSTGCFSTAYSYEGYYMNAIESDGTGNPDDDFGWRFSTYGAALPWSLSITTTEAPYLFYSKNAVPGVVPAQKSIYMRLKIE